jgi:hypothetical protein
MGGAWRRDVGGFTEGASWRSLGCVSVVGLSIFIIGEGEVVA